MKKKLVLGLTIVMVLSLTACVSEKDKDGAEDTNLDSSVEDEDLDSLDEDENLDSSDEDDNDSEVAVMTYADYMAAEVDDAVVIEAYVQAKQAWWDGKATVYAADQDGAYFIYDMVCSEDDYALLVPGAKIRVTGYKTEWSGEIEIAEGATFEMVEAGDSYIAEATDVTELLGTDSLIDSQNQLVAFKGMTVEASKDADGQDVAYLYKWDGSGEDGDDLYFNVSINGATYTFTVESYLCDNSTEVYQAVKSLNVGDVIDMEGFLYWYEGVNPHITSVTASSAN